MTTNISQLGDRISALTLSEARHLSEYLKDVYGIKPAAAPMVVPPRDDSQPEPIATPLFNVVLTGFRGSRIAIIRAVRAVTGLGLQESRQAVDSLPYTVKESLSPEDAERLKAQLEEAGGDVELR